MLFKNWKLLFKMVHQTPPTLSKIYCPNKYQTKKGQLLICSLDKEGATINMFIHMFQDSLSSSMAICIALENEGDHMENWDLEFINQE